MSSYFRQAIYKTMEKEGHVENSLMSLCSLIGIRAENLKIKDLAADSEPHRVVDNRRALNSRLSARALNKGWRVSHGKQKATENWCLCL